MIFHQVRTASGSDLLNECQVKPVATAQGSDLVHIFYVKSVSDTSAQ